jgi:hypothetical protein
MAQRVDRRAFVGAVVAGLPLAAVGAAVAQSQPGFDNGPRLQGDPVFAHLTKEFQRIDKVFKDGTFRADDYGALAANFRLAAAHARAHNLDAQLRAAVQRCVRRVGRREVLDLAMKHAHGNPTAADIEAALDRMLAGDITRPLEEMAAAVQGMHGQMQKRLAASGGANVVRIQSDFDAWLRCSILLQRCAHWQNQATIACGIAAIPIIGVPLIPVCAAMGASAAGYCGAAAYYGCY